MPRDVRISAEVLELVSELEPGALRHVVEAVEHHEVRCVISGRVLAPEAPVALIAYRDPSEGSVCLRCADARLHDSSVIDQPGLADELASAAMTKQERELTWCPFYNREVAGIAFEGWSRAWVPTREDETPREAERLAFEQLGWRAPVEGLRLDPKATLTLWADKVVLSVPELDPFEFGIGEEPLAPQWLANARQNREAVVLYGCGVPDRLSEALTLGDVVGVCMPFADRTRGYRRWRRRAR